MVVLAGVTNAISLQRFLSVAIRCEHFVLRRQFVAVHILPSHFLVFSEFSHATAACRFFSLSQPPVYPSAREA